MHCTKRITDDMTWVGADDRRLALFEGVYGVPDGVSYNSYLILDEKTILFDTVDKAVAHNFFDNVAYVLGGRKLDYLVISHMEPDHAATIEDIALRYPDAKIVCNAKIRDMLSRFFPTDLSDRIHLVKEGDTLSTGRHSFTFVMAPMVHWPEVMMTYEESEHLLFSADAFGSFGALSGNLFNDEVRFEQDWLADARRYYGNIVGKYGPQVQNALKKLSGLDIRVICPLHGVVWRSDLAWLLDKYDRWSRYEPEEKAVALLYASMYGDTENAVDILAGALAEGGVTSIAVYDVSSTHVSTLISDVFRCSHLVLATPTYNNGIYPAMLNFLHDMKALNLQNRTVGLIENGSWAPAAGKQTMNLLSELRDVRILEPVVTIKSSLKDEGLAVLMQLKDSILASLSQNG